MGYDQARAGDALAKGILDANKKAAKEDDAQIKQAIESISHSGNKEAMAQLAVAIRSSLSAPQELAILMGIMADHQITMQAAINDLKARVSSHYRR